MQHRMSLDNADNDMIETAVNVNMPIKRLAELCRPDRVVVTSASAIARGLPLLMLEHIESNSGNITTAPVASDGEIQSAAFLFDEKHVLYAKLRPYLNKVALPTFRGICTTELVPLLPFPNVSRRYLAWLLRRPETVAFAMQGKTGGRMPRANIDELLNLEVPIPEAIDEQERLADIMDHRFKTIERARLACIRQLRLLEMLEKRLLTDFPRF